MSKGNYKRTKERIKELEEEKRMLKEELESCDEGSDDFESITLEIVELDQAIGELEGYLQELASMDGYSSYSDYLEDSLLWE